MFAKSITVAALVAITCNAWAFEAKDDGRSEEDAARAEETARTGQAAMKGTAAVNADAKWGAVVEAMGRRVDQDPNCAAGSACAIQFSVAQGINRGDLSPAARTALLGLDREAALEMRAGQTPSNALQGAVDKANLPPEIRKELCGAQ